MLSNEINTIIEKLIDLQKNCNLSQYCIGALNLFNSNKTLMSIKDFEDYLNQEEGLFPIVSTIYQNIHIGNWYIVINFLYHFDDLNNKQDLINKNVSITQLLDFKSSKLIWKEINFDIEKLLSINDRNKWLTFLFLYFLPIYIEREFDFDYNRDEPNLTSLEITNENFQILLYLWNKFPSIKKEKYNLLFIFVKNYIYSSKFKFKNIDELITIEKLNSFFKMGFSASDLESYFSETNVIIYNELFENIKEKETIFLYKNLSSSLKNTKDIEKIKKNKSKL